MVIVMVGRTELWRLSTDGGAVRSISKSFKRLPITHKHEPSIGHGAWRVKKNSVAVTVEMEIIAGGTAAATARGAPRRPSKT